MENRMAMEPEAGRHLADKGTKLENIDAAA